LSFIIELLIEFIIQLAVECLVELGIHKVRNDRRSPHPLLSLIGYIFLGGLLGFISCLIFPQHLISNDFAQIVNLVITPIAVGAVLGFIGQLRAKRGMSLIRLDKFSYGYAFALAFALARYALGTTGI
jgi:hypothetical protein